MQAIKNQKPSWQIGNVWYTDIDSDFEFIGYLSKDYKMLTRRLEALSYNDVWLYEGAFLYAQGGRKDVNFWKLGSTQY